MLQNQKKKRQLSNSVKALIELKACSDGLLQNKLQMRDVNIYWL